MYFRLLIDEDGQGLWGDAGPIAAPGFVPFSRTTACTVG